MVKFSCLAYFLVLVNIHVKFTTLFWIDGLNPHKNGKSLGMVYQFHLCPHSLIVKWQLNDYNPHLLLLLVFVLLFLVSLLVLLSVLLSRPFLFFVPLLLTAALLAILVLEQWESMIILHIYILYIYTYVNVFKYMYVYIYICIIRIHVHI